MGNLVSHFRRIEYRGKLFIFFVIWWAVWAINPVHPSDWRLENVLTVLFIPILIATRNSFRLSNLSYTLIGIFLSLHTVGAHYTYAEVPYDRWFKTLFGTTVNEIFGFQRNHFDRLVHFLFGLLMAYPIREVFVRIANVRGIWGYYLPLDLTMSLSMLYELVEWGASILFGGDLGAAYLGTQGDNWDAHKDMALATSGAVICMVVTALVNWRYQRDFAAEMRDSLKVKGKTPLGEVKLREMREEGKGGR